MRKSFIITTCIYIPLWFSSYFISIYLFWGLTFLGVISGVLLFSLLLINALVKRTNWWKNQYIATKQFVSNSGYRDNLIRNYEVVNLGSNPARFAFFYDKINGQSWSTGSQGPDMDFEILRFYHSYIKREGFVLIPIMPFSAISTYLREQPNYWGVEYYSKFAKILDGSQLKTYPYSNIVQRYLNYPILYKWSAIKNLIIDEAPDKRDILDVQPMMRMELRQDAVNRINSWKKEFGLKDLTDVKNVAWSRYYEESALIYRQIVDYSLERNLQPVFICIPMTKHLSSLFPQEFFRYMVYDFIEKANTKNVPFLDYTNDTRFTEDSLFFNSLFMNLKGRKIFTNQVILDLGIVK